MRILTRRRFLLALALALIYGGGVFVLAELWPPGPRLELRLEKPGEVRAVSANGRWLATQETRPEDMNFSPHFFPQTTTLQLWDAEAGRKAASLAVPRALHRLCLTGDGRQAVAIVENQNGRWLRLYEVATGTALYDKLIDPRATYRATAPGPDGPGGSVRRYASPFCALTADDATLVVATNRSLAEEPVKQPFQVRFIDRATGSVRNTLILPNGDFFYWNLSFDGARLVWTRKEGEAFVLELLDVATGMPVHEFRYQHPRVRGVSPYLGLDPNRALIVLELTEDEKPGVERRSWSGFTWLDWNTKELGSPNYHNNAFGGCFTELANHCQTPGETRLLLVGNNDGRQLVDPASCLVRFGYQAVGEVAPGGRTDVRGKALLFPAADARHLAVRQEHKPRPLPKPIWLRSVPDGWIPSRLWNPTATTRWTTTLYREGDPAEATHTLPNERFDRFLPDQQSFLSSNPEGDVLRVWPVEPHRPWAWLLTLPAVPVLLLSAALAIWPTKRAAKPA